MSLHRVGGGAGFAGDRVEPAVALAASGRCDTLVLECLAERTLVSGLEARRRDPHRGYDPRLRRRLTPLLGTAARNGCRIVTNLGSANPLAAATEVAALAAELGLDGLTIAAVTGDDVLGAGHPVRWEEAVTGGELLGAHAYLGADPIRRAVDSGADVVVTGRVADASLTVGPVWSMLDDEQALAGATTVGHLLECSGQLTGGNFDAPTGPTPGGRPTGADIGYPLAAVAPDGTATITKLDGTGGHLDAMTCTLQLLYEVHDPYAYVTPDAVVDLSGVSFEVVGPDEVAVSGARYAGVPDELKVVGFLARPGAISDLEIAYAGHGAAARAEAAAGILRTRLSADPAVEELQVDLVGVDSVLRGAGPRPQAPPPELRVHVSARFGTEEAALIAEDEVFGLTLTGPGGGCCVRSERRPRLETVTGWIARADVSAEVTQVGAP